MTSPANALALVTGGGGFIGSSLVKRLVSQGRQVRVLDDFSRKSVGETSNFSNDIELVKGDIREPDVVSNAMENVSEVFHLAYINGTENFSSDPGLVLDVAVRGQLNILDAANRSKTLTKLIYASSSEVYQTPPKIPTPEDVPMSVPDVKNPRYSYGGGKIISELMMQHYSHRQDQTRITVRFHNVYGPAMGFEHVIPQISRKIFDGTDGLKNASATIEIQGSGEETRSFCFIDDAVDGMLIAAENGSDRDIYNIGVTEQTTISSLVEKIADFVGINVSTTQGQLQPGGTLHRCPNILKLAELGYRPKVLLSAGLEKTVPWYVDYLHQNN